MDSRIEPCTINLQELLWQLCYKKVHMESEVWGNTDDIQFNYEIIVQ